MPMNYSNPLAGLRTSQPNATRPALLRPEEMYQDWLPGATGNPGMQDPSLSLDTFNRNMLGELRGRKFAADRLGESNESAALAGLASGYEQDINDSPLTRQMGEVNKFRDASLKAGMQGFGSPQEEAAYGRKWGERETLMPLESARVTGDVNRQTALDQAKAQGKNAIDLENSRHGNFMELQRYLSERTGGAPVSAVGRTAGGYATRFDTNGPSGGAPKPMAGASSLMGQLPRLTAFYERSKGGAQEASAKAALDAARQQVLSARTDVDSITRDWANTIANDPQLSQMPFPTLQATLMQSLPEDTADMTPQEWAQLDELLRMLRGQE